MPYHSILLDADNTLFDFDRSERQALKGAIEEFGGAFEESFTETYHRINAACWRAYEDGRMSKEVLRVRRFEELFEAIGMEADATTFADAYLDGLAATDHLIDGALDLLDALAGRFQLILVTNGLAEVQHPRLDNTGLRRFFQAIVISDEIGVSKPHAGFFDHTLLHLRRQSKSEVLMVGDNLKADIGGAEAYGFHTCWYNPRRQVNDTGVRPTYEIEALAQLPELLDEGPARF